jgi:type II secretory pathway component GspD/PulD (secretin)
MRWSIAQQGNTAMKIRVVLLASLAFAVLTTATGAGAQTSSEESGPVDNSAGHAEGGIPIERLIAAVARKTGKKFVLDPRVRASVILVGQDPLELTYAQLLTVLAVYGFYAADDGGLVRVLPDASVRISAPDSFANVRRMPDQRSSATHAANGARATGLSASRASMGPGLASSVVRCDPRTPAVLTPSETDWGFADMLRQTTTV